MIVYAGDLYDGRGHAVEAGVLEPLLKVILDLGHHGQHYPATIGAGTDHYVGKVISRVGLALGTQKYVTVLSPN